MKPVPRVDSFPLAARRPPSIPSISSTRLRSEGAIGDYDTVTRWSSTPGGSTDAAAEESLDAIGEALNENGRSSSPAVWGKGRPDPARPIRSVWKCPALMQPERDGGGSSPALPKPTTRSVDLVPTRESGDPQHYAYLKISEA